MLVKLAGWLATTKRFKKWQAAFIARKEKEDAKEDAVQKVEAAESKQAAKELELIRNEFGASSKEYKEKLKDINVERNVKRGSTKVFPISTSEDEGKKY